MHKDSTTQAKQKKDEREEVLKEIRQLENRQKILENKQRFPAGSRPFRRGGQSVPDCPVPSSGGCGIDCKPATIRGYAISPLFTRAHLYTVSGAVRASSQSPLCSVPALRRKLHTLPCSSFPPQKPLRWVSVGAPYSGVAYFVRDGALRSPNPLCAPRSQTPALRLSGSTEPVIPH